MLNNMQADPRVEQLLSDTSGMKRILLTTHRRESFGKALTANLEAIRDFVSRRSDVCLFFPVHPNPNVRLAATEILGGRDRIHLLEPLDYSAFLAIMRSAWLIVSDSGGVQEEAPSLGKPLLILRENTERPEAVSSGVAKLVGSDPKALKRMLESNYANDAWTRSVVETANPFGDGRAAARIVRHIEEQLMSAGMRAAA
jgi:UDP-N-acetylglucosamine 2-epimerase (non-hydrolysing)